MAVLLDTDEVPPPERQDALRQVLSLAAAAHEVRFLGSTPPPRARLTAWRLGADVTVMRELSTGIAHWRDERHDRMDGPERIAFVLHDGPAGAYSCDGHETALRAGALYAADLTAHFAFWRPAPGDVRILQIERSAIGFSVERVRAAVPAIARSPLYALFRSQLAETVAAAEAISGSAAATDVAAALVARASGLLRTTDAGEATTDFLRERIALYLRSNFRRRDLSPEFVAYAHNISVRYLFKLWSGQPLSLMDTVYALRLEHAHRLLESRPAMPIGLVAAESGFESASHFSRRFRAAYGTSPGEARRRVHAGARRVH
jgi:AraC-like DNA-binding protein